RGCRCSGACPPLRKPFERFNAHSVYEIVATFSESACIRDQAMSMLPEAKLDVLLAHHASLEARLLGQVNSDDYVRITRELAELNPLIEAVKPYRAVNAEIAGIDALIADPATEPEMRAMAEA